jgi:class 3 adenylate cyclase
MKPGITIFLLFLGLISSFAQNTSKDSLLADWNNESLDMKTRYKSMRDLVYEVYLFTNPDTAYILAEEALQKSSASNDLYWMVRFSSLMGISLAIRGKSQEAYDIFLKSLEWSYELDLPADIATSLAQMGNISHHLGNYQEAIRYHMEAWKVFENGNDPDNAAASCTALGNIYRQIKDYDNAQAYYEKGLVLADSLENRNRMAVILQNLGELLKEKGDWEDALQYYEKGLEIKEENNYHTGIPTSLASIGEIHLKLKDYPKSKHFLERAIDKSREIGNPQAESHALVQLGYWHLESGQMTEARRSGEMAHRIAKDIGNNNNLGRAAKLLYTVYKDLGLASMALEMYETHIRVRDEVNNEENNRELISQQYKYEYEKKEALAKLEEEKKDAIAAANLKRQKTLRNTALGGFGLMLLSSLIFLAQRNRIKKEKAISEELLLNILPYEVAEELKEKGSAEAKLFDQATVLFTDFKHFTKIAENLSPSQLVKEIDICFQAFDRIMEKYGIEKIKTIGDAYMAAGGLPVVDSASAVDVVNAALDIRDYMLEHKRDYLEKGREIFEIRIGLHSGPVVAGIVGIKKFQYDIWGDTVNAAARMESSGEEGMVNISGETYELVKDHFKCKHRGKIVAKNKGEVDMYFVERT